MPSRTPEPDPRHNPRCVGLCDEIAVPQADHIKKLDIMLIGKGRAPSLDPTQLLASIAIQSYASMISSARAEMDWLIGALAPAMPVVDPAEP
jgi:hypothetical protein